VKVAQSGPMVGYSRDLPVNLADAQGYGHLVGDNPAPTATGVYSLRLPSGRVRRVRVRRMNGILYLMTWLTATPIDQVAGEWIT
jgi:hypothetical protein